MVQKTQRPQGKINERGKEGGKEARGKEPVLSFEHQIDERAKRLEERIGKIHAQIDAQKNLLQEHTEELRDEDKVLFAERMHVLLNRLVHVAEQVGTNIVIPLEKQEAVWKETDKAREEEHIRGLGKFDDKRQIFIADDEKKTEIDVRVPELGHKGTCGFSITGEVDGMRVAFHYEGYTLEIAYHSDSQKFDVYHTRREFDKKERRWKDVIMTYEDSYGNPDRLPEVFEHFKEKVRGDKERERLDKQMREEERRAVQLNGDETDGIKRARSGGTPRIEDAEALQRKLLERQGALERSRSIKGKEIAQDVGSRPQEEPLPVRPSLPPGIKEIPINVDVGGGSRKRFVKRMPVVERGNGAHQLAPEVSTNGFYEIGDIGEYNPTTGQITIHDAHFGLNIPGVRRESIETSVDGGDRVILASFYGNHYFIELRYNAAEKKCMVAVYFDTVLQQEHIVQEDKDFGIELPKVVEHAKRLVYEEVSRLQTVGAAKFRPTPSSDIGQYVRPIDEYIESLDAKQREKEERERIAEATKKVQWERITDPETLRRGALVRSQDGRMGTFDAKRAGRYYFIEESTGQSFSLSEQQFKIAKLEQLKEPVREMVGALQKQVGSQIQTEVRSFNFKENERSQELLEHWNRRSREELKALDRLQDRLPSYPLSHRDYASLVGQIERLRAFLQNIEQTPDRELQKKFAAAFIFYAQQLDDEVRSLNVLQRTIAQVDAERAAKERPVVRHTKEPKVPAVLEVQKEKQRKIGGELGQVIELGQRALSDFERQVQELPEADRREVVQEIEQLKKLLDAEEPSQAIIEATLERIRSIFKRLGLQRATQSELGAAAAARVQKAQTENGDAAAIAAIIARDELEELFSKGVKPGKTPDAPDDAVELTGVVEPDAVQPVDDADIISVEDEPSPSLAPFPSEPAMDAVQPLPLPKAAPESTITPIRAFPSPKARQAPVESKPEVIDLPMRVNRVEQFQKSTDQQKFLRETPLIPSELEELEKAGLIHFEDIRSLDFLNPGAVCLFKRGGAQKEIAVYQGKSDTGSYQFLSNTRARDFAMSRTNLAEGFVTRVVVGPKAVNVDTIPAGGFDEEPTVIADVEPKAEEQKRADELLEILKNDDVETFGSVERVEVVDEEIEGGFEIKNNVLLVHRDMLYG